MASKGENDQWSNYDFFGQPPAEPEDQHFFDEEFDYYKDRDEEPFLGPPQHNKTQTTEGSSTKSRTQNFLEWGVVLLVVPLLVFILRTFVIAPFWIPSGSMEPTLEVKDQVLVNKLSYRFSDIQRGDIIVISQDNSELEEDLIKRVIALPGETVEIRDNTVIINGDTSLDESEYLAENVVETDFTEVAVPDNHLFVLGDNRANSNDSTEELGMISENRVIGRAFARFWPLKRFGSL